MLFPLFWVPCTLNGIEPRVKLMALNRDEPFYSPWKFLEVCLTQVGILT